MDSNRRPMSLESHEAEWLDHVSGNMSHYAVGRTEYVADYMMAPKNVLFYEHIVLPFCENTLLMDNIAASEGIHYEKGEKGIRNRLVIEVFNQNKRLQARYPELTDLPGSLSSVSYPDNFPYVVVHRDYEPDAPYGTTLDEAFARKEIDGDDFEVCIRSEHSLFSILENFIRNSAKHNKATLNAGEPREGVDYRESGLRIFIDITDEETDHYTVTLYDNVSRMDGAQLSAFCKKVQASLLTDTGEMNRNHLGLADMKINAHLLAFPEEISPQNITRSMKLCVCDSPMSEDRPAFQDYYFLTKAEESHLLAKYPKGRSFRFGYRFRLCKPKKILWIGAARHSAGRVEELSKKGIGLYRNLEEYRTAPKKSLSSYDFAILESSLFESTGLTGFDWDLFETEILPIDLPSRVFLNSSIEGPLVNERLRRLLEQRRIHLPAQPFPTDIADAFSLLETCWQAWIKRWQTKKPCLCVYFEERAVCETWKDLHIESELFDFHCMTGGDGVIRSYPALPDPREGRFYIIYDHHGRCAAHLRTCIAEDSGFRFIAHNSYFQFDKSSKDFCSFYYPALSNKKENILFLYKAIEAGLTSILLVDERICGNAGSGHDDRDIRTLREYGNVALFPGPGGVGVDREVYLKDLMNFGRTFLVTELNGATIASSKNYSIDFYENEISIGFPEYIEETVGDIDALIIHRTYMDQLLKDLEGEERNSFIRGMYAKFPNIVVISGGGAAHSLDLPVKFRTFSNINAHFSKYQSKISLLNIIK